MNSRNPDTNRHLEADQPEQEPRRVIAPDEDFEKLIDDNAEEAWLKYCELNGLDPDSDKEG